MDLPAIAWYAAVGLAMAVVTAIGGALLVLYLPSNYFSRSTTGASESRTAVSWALVVVKNLLGVVLIGLGIVMLVLPGQGLLTMQIGLMLLSIPGKRQLIAAAIRRSGMLASVNRWRAKLGREPLSIPAKT